MRILDRICLAVYSLVTVCLALGAAVFLSRLVSSEMIWANFGYLYGRWEPVLAVLALAVLGVYLFFASFRGTRHETQCEAIEIEALGGGVRIASSAVKDMLAKTLYGVEGVQDVKVDVLANKRKAKNEELPGAFKIRLRLAVHPEVNIPSLSEKVRQVAGEKIHHVIGMDAAVIEVHILEMKSTNGKEKPRVV